MIGDRFISNDPANCNLFINNIHIFSDSDALKFKVDDIQKKMCTSYTDVAEDSTPFFSRIQLRDNVDFNLLLKK